MESGIVLPEESNVILELFGYENLPVKLAVIAVPFYKLAVDLDTFLPESEDKTDTLRKLLIARNAAVRTLFNLNLPENT